MNSVAEPLYYPHFRFRHARPDLRMVLVLAVALHAALLLIPSRQPAPMAPPQSVTVDVRFEPAPFAQPEPITESIPPEPLPLTEIPAEAMPETTLAEPSQATQAADSAEQAPPQSARPPPSTAYLLETARTMDWQLETPSLRIPGVPFIPDLPQNLTRPIMPLAPNAFDGYVLPTQAEVMDQWIDASGVINAVIKTPTGEILCGSIRPWDPMDPLVEHVAMYRTCGGGGKRKASTGAAFPFRN